MKSFTFILLLALFSCSDKTPNTPKLPDIVFDSTWINHSISGVLSISLPDSGYFIQDGVMMEYVDSCSAGIYGVDYFDTIVVAINNEPMYWEALKGYLTGMLTGDYLRFCELNIIDTSIGNSNGYYITGSNTDTLSWRKYPFCYLTTENSKLVWFFAFQNERNITNETRQFFGSIKFDDQKRSERGFVLPKTRIRRDPDYF